MKQTFKKYERLNSKKAIAALFKSKHSLFVYPFKVFFTENTSSHHQLLISIPKKNIRQAVKRNLLKRRIRESYRKNKPVIYFAGKLCNPCLNIALIYVAKEPLPYSVIEKKITVILQEIAHEVYR
jgi:ribonuclease P protein component